MRGGWDGHYVGADERAKREAATAAPASSTSGGAARAASAAPDGSSRPAPAGGRAATTGASPAPSPAVLPAPSPAAPAGAARIPTPRPLRERDRWTVGADGERPAGRGVPRAAAACALVFVTLAIASAVLERPLTPIAFGGGLLVDLIVEAWPGLYWVSSLHYACLAAIATHIAVATSTGHAPMPGTHDDPNTLVYRRRSRFVGDELACAGVLGAIGLALQHHWGLPLAAMPFEWAADGFLLKALVIAVVPSARNWLIVMTSRADGIGNRDVTGGGLGLFPKPARTSHHWELASARPTYSLVGWAADYAGLELIHRHDTGAVRVTRYRHFGSVRMTNDVVDVLMGPYRIARRGQALESLFAAPVTEWTRSAASGR